MYYTLELDSILAKDEWRNDWEQVVTGAVRTVASQYNCFQSWKFTEDKPKN